MYYFVNQLQGRHYALVTNMYLRDGDQIMANMCRAKTDHISEEYMALRPG